MAYTDLKIIWLMDFWTDDLPKSLKNELLKNQADLQIGHFDSFSLQGNILNWVKNRVHWDWVISEVKTEYTESLLSHAETIWV